MVWYNPRMSALPDHAPECTEKPSGAVELVIENRPRDLGGFSVRRSLPSVRRRLVGPFIFFDHMGPSEFAPGHGIEVRPHPHIGLATITYLFEGAISHKDSLGSDQVIVPGDVNWMVAGRGIVHSERAPAEQRRDGSRLHGIQTWIALPLEHEETAPVFEHHPSRTIPSVQLPGVELHVIAGTAYGQKAPTNVLWPTLYVAAKLAPEAKLTVDDEHEERAVYVVEGSLDCDGSSYGEGTMLVLRPRADVTVGTQAGARLMMVGGKPIDGERHIFWNFVSSSEARIERAKQDWRAGQFAKVPSDDVEFIPLPD